ncbi:ABC transporter ATP-binding protein [Kibdelosporangium phytohabitans]|uniref:ABC transporter ATP-binding protein n=1 Tax=Kibdelosporangium phytohabitans TaxID=860235 RepID=UPI0014705131|nr:ABC transporter ATP-binding protein [Kibdelosporangium phytohabitans]MBE1469991.1 branched-chain amino acid transport system ATP-binding protein [Kibdelosporangium phytohabitans]
MKAVDDVSLSVAQGTRHALIGPNGAGKSTLFKLITGLLRSDSGRVCLAGQDVTTASEVRRCRLGISQTMQHASVFPTMSVAENVALAARRHTGRVSWIPRRETEVHARTDELLDQVTLTGRGGVQVDALSHGERKQLEVALALACRPTLLLLDEPAAGMSAAERARLVTLISGLPREVTVLFVEHDLDVVFELADTVTVLNLGRVLLSGDPVTGRASDEVRRAYLGGVR